MTRDKTVAQQHFKLLKYKENSLTNKIAVCILANR